MTGMLNAVGIRVEMALFLFQLVFAISMHTRKLLAVWRAIAAAAAAGSVARVPTAAAAPGPPVASPAPGPAPSPKPDAFGETFEWRERTPSVWKEFRAHPTARAASLELTAALTSAAFATAVIVMGADGNVNQHGLSLIHI